MSVATMRTARTAVATRMTVDRGDDDDGIGGRDDGDGGGMQMPWHIGMPNCCAIANVVGRVRRPAKARSSRLELPNARCTFHFPSPLPTCAWREILPR